MLLVEPDYMSGAVIGELQKEGAVVPGLDDSGDKGTGGVSLQVAGTAK